MLTTLRDKRLIVPAVMTGLMLPLLIGLGAWQLQRKAWKDGLIHDIESRTAAAPMALDTAIAAWGGSGSMEYVPVVARGHFQHKRERFLTATDGAMGPGWHILTPLETAEGTVVIVNRGYVPNGLREPALRAGGEISAEVEIIGLVRGSAERNAFTPDNDVEKNIWYWRDISGLTASMFGSSPPKHAPFLIEALARPENPGGWPRGGVTIIALPNRHLEYAITWFGLAAVLVGVFVVYAAGRVREPEKP